ncbi:zinc ribbon domain-containing protein [Gudongella sp. SC589]|uniref:zinc ribbon domain-containing protein n=1 Tax=Gudongella sp. SC589 TaxID=3385990 RepID=UPI003904C837
MLDLSSLWEIEIHRKSLFSMENELKLLQERAELQKLEKDHQNLERRYENLLKKKKDLRLHLRKLEQEADIHKEKYRVAEANLYNGSVKDIKQLEHLEKEKEYHKNLVDTLEDEIIDTMGINEENEIKIDETGKLKSNTKRNLAHQISIVDDRITQLSMRIEVEKRTIENLEGSIEEKLLTKYHDISRRKGSGIAKMKEDVCTGCHMHIPEKIVEKAKQGKVVVTCENCGRILYHDLEQEDI